MNVHDEIIIPGQEARHGETPAWLADSPAWPAVKAQTGGGQLYLHQAMGLELFGQGHNLAVSTGTASGKSLVFQAPTLDHLASHPNATAYRLVQELLAAKRDLDLPRQLRKLDNFDFLLLDDLGYLPQGAEESEVLFTLIAERYERRSLGITSNLVFSEWERIFANPMATAAAIDRVVHHSVILEFDVPSYRTNAAQQRGQAKEVNRQN